MRISTAGLLSFVLAVQVGCASGKKWVHQPFHRSAGDKGIHIYDPREGTSPSSYDKSTAQLRQPADDTAVAVDEADPNDAGPRPHVELVGKAKLNFRSPSDGRLLGVFRNTYYDFPAEATYPISGELATKTGVVDLMDKSCQSIKKVARGFYESLCVQGSGTLLDGRTVSFARRDCSCAAICPKTSQHICFDVLDSSQFPWGRGALGTNITPLLTVAVDSDVIPLGTRIYIAEFDGVERHAGGGRHNGCFVAEDRGMKVQGKHVDIFSGNPSVTQHLNQLVPSNVGVHVYVGTSRCAADAQHP